MSKSMVSASPPIDIDPAGEYGDLLRDCDVLAVGLSGGPDSTALAHLLRERFGAGRTVHAVTVDHGLRAESAAEAKQAGQWLSGMGGMVHAVLPRPPPEAGTARVQERAREDRYRLMADYCRSNGIRHLFLAHHMDDQAETFLFRLAKGSGLDGLACMQGVSAYDDRLLLCRPLLAVPKKALIAYCGQNALSYVRDPSNENGRFARARLRAAGQALADEGLTAERLAVTAERLREARQALEYYAEQLYGAAASNEYPDRIVFKISDLASAPFEIRKRVFIKALEAISLNAGESRAYGPRLRDVEALVRAAFAGEPFKRRSFYNCLISRDLSKNMLVIAKEH